MNTEDIIEEHERWLAGHEEGKQANLRLANLSGANLSWSNLSEAIGLPTAPALKNIDAAILAAINAPGCDLKMSEWHTCGTTHCRAGWAITLAGQAGADLEKQFGASMAGALIYAASRPGKLVPDFFASNEEAMADLVACANETKT